MKVKNSYRFQFTKPVTIFILVVLLVWGISAETMGQTDTSSLYEVYEEAFMMGTILNWSQIFAEAPELTRDTIRTDRRGYFLETQIIPDREGLRLAMEHFKAITPENVMKWEEIHPESGVYDFEAADRLVGLALAEDKFIVAHTLIWHNQTPDWVFEDEHGNELSREALLARMRDHIQTIVGRYKGRIHGWDVVNEAILDDGSYRESRWYQIIGKEFIPKAFEYAHEADPDAELYYNDYRLENPEKRAGIIALIRELKEKGVPITGVGSQSHLSLRDFPDYKEIEASITDIAELGLDLMITELDINVLPSARNEDGSLKRDTDIYRDGLPDEVQAELADTYKHLFEIYLRHSDDITRVTFWGVADSGSWLNYLPAERVNYPLLFDRDNQPKPAFDALMELANTHFKN